MQIDFPCICGHILEMHPKWIRGNRGSDCCEGCWKANPNRTRYEILQQSCKRFIPDNLKYLEQLSKIKE
jgi:hypothetical protein